MIRVCGRGCMATLYGAMWYHVRGVRYVVARFLINEVYIERYS